MSAWVHIGTTKGVTYVADSVDIAPNGLVCLYKNLETGDGASVIAVINLGPGESLSKQDLSPLE